MSPRDKGQEGGAPDVSTAGVVSPVAAANDSKDGEHRILASIPVSLLNMSSGHLAKPTLARLDNSGENLLLYLPVGNGANNSGMDPTLKHFAKEVITANQDNLKKGRLQRELPYWTVFVMNLILFGVGLIAFGAAIVRGLSGDPVSTATFGGITISAIISTFLLNPITSLQKSNLLNTGLVCLINTYWDRLLYFEDPKTIDADLKRATEDTVNGLESLRKSYLSKDTAQPDANK